MTKLIGGAGLMLLALTGCMNNTYVTGASPGAAVHKESAAFFLYGLIGEKEVNLQQICPQGVATFRDYQSFGNGCLNALTCGIYSPLTVEVTCASGSSYLAVPDSQEGVTWVYDTNELEGAQ